mmetsp:Transcript_56782/g.176088  ORF Transcript_56782/g.176088 Transcript_56782/m.176088 type:complete len:249 (+) Transcript_56782:390-1136(+)
MLALSTLSRSETSLRRASIGLTHTTMYSRHSPCVSSWNRSSEWPAKLLAVRTRPELGTSSRWMKPKSNSGEWARGQRSLGSTSVTQSESRRHSTARRWTSGSPLFTSQFSGLKMTMIPGKSMHVKGTPGRRSAAATARSSPPGAVPKTAKSRRLPKSTMCFRKGSATVAVILTEKAKDHESANRSATNASVSSTSFCRGCDSKSRIFAIAAAEIACISCSSAQPSVAYAHEVFARFCDSISLILRRNS